MARAKQDLPKRKCAQALNHLAGAVIDINEVYEMFDQSIQQQIDNAVEQGQSTESEAITRYKGYRERLRQVMMYIVVPREEVIKLIAEMWELDEESIKVYLG